MGNYDRKMQYLNQICDALNNANILFYVGRDNEGNPKYSKWIPSNYVFLSIISNTNAYNFLKANNLLNTGICPDCGEFPIDSKYTFTSGYNSDVKYNLCKDCYNTGKAMSINPANDQSGCYIATACYGDFNSPEVLFFRQYRDNVLIKNSLGKFLVRLYYIFSPKVA
jgi:hypothetical protein